ncbi:MAG: hypothetical protein LKG24_02420 [Lacticaseibacillus songhuajiangensis]|jgi:hypothetical protein|nr:hypothetical protein [Lacticaseibacillus songhuajiangensis]
MMMVFNLVADTPEKREYRIQFDNSEATATVIKCDMTYSFHGTKSPMFSDEFIEQLVRGTFNIEKAPQRFTYGVG